MTEPRIGRNRNQRSSDRRSSVICVFVRLAVRDSNSRSSHRIDLLRRDRWRGFLVGMTRIGGRDVRGRAAITESRRRRLVAQARPACDRRVINYSARMLGMLRQPFRRPSSNTIQQ